MIRKLLSNTKELLKELRKNEEGASHILEIAASLAIITVILSAVFPHFTQDIIAKINDTITRAIASF